MALQSSSSLRSPPPRRAKALIPGSEGHQGTSREGSKRRGVTRKCCKGPERGLCFVGQTPCISRITISCACIRPCAYQRAVFGIQNSELLVNAPGTMTGACALFHIEDRTVITMERAMTQQPPKPKQKPDPKPGPGKPGPGGR